MKWLIIDGYSLLHRDPTLKPLLRRDLETARQLLVRKVELIAPDWAERITIVFDGKGERTSRLTHAARLEIVFAPSQLTADTVIERLVFAAAGTASILVVTSDRAERQMVVASGAETMSCGDFIALGERQKEQWFRQKRPASPLRPTLGDHFPALP
jgi:uncharacterized protein